MTPGSQNRESAVIIFHRHIAKGLFDEWQDIWGLSEPLDSVAEGISIKGHSSWIRRELGHAREGS